VAGFIRVDLVFCLASSLFRVGSLLFSQSLFNHLIQFVRSEEESADKPNKERVDQEKFQVRHQSGESTRAVVCLFIRVLAVRTSPVFSASAKSVLADSTVLALSKALRHLFVGNSNVGAHVHLTLLGFPLELENAGVANDVLGEANLLCFEVCLKTTAGERTVFIGTVIKRNQNSKVPLIGRISNAKSAVSARRRGNRFPSDEVFGAWCSIHVHFALEGSTAGLLGEHAPVVDLALNGRENFHLLHKATSQACEI